MKAKDRIRSKCWLYDVVERECYTEYRYMFPDGSDAVVGIYPEGELHEAVITVNINGFDLQATRRYFGYSGTDMLDIAEKELGSFFERFTEGDFKQISSRIDGKSAVVAGGYIFRKHGKSI